MNDAICDLGASREQAAILSHSQPFQSRQFEAFWSKLQKVSQFKTRAEAT
jgi:hypothetical protein